MIIHYIVIISHLHYLFAVLFSTRTCDDILHVNQLLCFAMCFQTSLYSQPLSELVAGKICRNSMQTPCIYVYFLHGFGFDGQAFLEHLPSEKIITQVFAASTVFSAAAGLFIFTLQGRVSATKHVSMTW